MKKPKERVKNKLPKILEPVHEEVFNLLDMFEFYLDERAFNKPIEILADSVRDLRIIVQQLLLEHFLRLGGAEAERFIKALAVVLAKRSAKVPVENREDKKYMQYCIGEVLTAFEWAQEIKKEYPDDPSTQRILALDIPVLRPFDYGLKSKIRLVKSPRQS